MALKITPEMTVKDINIKYPAAQEVFKKYGIGGCGGQYGPPEPVDFFARAHNVNLEQLIRDLEQAASTSPSQIVKPSSPTQEEVDEARLNKLYKLFVKAALVFTLSGGTLWGVVALTWIALTGSYSAPYYALTQAHGHMQTLGWVGLFIMGVAYYVIPKFKMSKLRDSALAYLSFILMTAGIALRGIVQPLANIIIFNYLNVLSGAMELIAVVCFAYLMVRIAMESKEKSEFFEKYLFASIAYFLIVMFWNFFMVIDMFATGVNVIRHPYNSIFLHLLLVGFVGLMILGVSMRVLPHFMGLSEPKAKLSDISFYLINLGIILNVIGSLTKDFLLASHILFISYILEFAAAVLFVYALQIFAKPRTILNIEGVDNSYMRFIKLSYFWFLVSSFMILFASYYYSLKNAYEIPHFYLGAYRHALTVGFITTIMMGVAHRILPVFNGTSLYSNKLMRVSFFLILFGNIDRVVSQLATGFFGKPAFLLMGTSGYFEFTALALFSYNIWKTLNYCEIAPSVSPTTQSSDIISESTKLYEILTKYPQLRETLVELGFKKLSDPNFVRLIPKFVTLQAACKVESIDLNKVLDTLQNKIKE